tara:strand:- start:386 stop:685 length:300 start_codon:yes stop_codon:yes gene_type:complete
MNLEGMIIEIDGLDFDVDGYIELYRDLGSGNTAGIVECSNLENKKFIMLNYEFNFEYQDVRFKDLFEIKDNEDLDLIRISRFNKFDNHHIKNVLTTKFE